MGSRGIGHLRYLCDIAPPDVSVVVNVGVAHIAEFGSVEGTAVAKGELVEALPPSGLAVLNADDPGSPRWPRAPPRTVVLAGEVGDADRPRHRRAPRTSAGGPASPARPRRRRRAGPARRRRSAPGRQRVLAAAVASHAGVDPADDRRHLGDLRAVSTRRMDVFDRADDVTVIDDSYNANPASMAAALRALAAVAGGRRMIAVLGFMAELGEHERTGHEEVGRLAAELGVDRLMAVGEQAAPILRRRGPSWRVGEETRCS